MVNTHEQKMACVRNLRVNQPFKHYPYQKERNKRNRLALRYAPDFVVIHKPKNGVEAAKTELERSVQTSKQSRKPEKTRIGNTKEAGLFLAFI